MTEHVYRIKDWGKHFENAKSRTYENCRYVSMPNKHGGMGWSMILSEPDGLALFGVWCLLIQLCSRHKERSGWLTLDGYSTDTARTPDDLAVSFRCKPEFIDRALQFFCSPKVRWMERFDAPRIAEGYQPDTTRIPQDPRLDRLDRLEGKEGVQTPPPTGFSLLSKEIQDRLQPIKNTGVDLERTPGLLGEWITETYGLTAGEVTEIMDDRVPAWPSEFRAWCEAWVKQRDQERAKDDQRQIEARRAGAAKMRVASILRHLDKHGSLPDAKDFPNWPVELPAYGALKAMPKAEARETLMRVAGITEAIA